MDLEVLNAWFAPQRDPEDATEMVVVEIPDSLETVAAKADLIQPFRAAVDRLLGSPGWQRLPEALAAELHQNAERAVEFASQEAKPFTPFILGEGIFRRRLAAIHERPAGFARGLNKDVIGICPEKLLNNKEIHFDANHYLFIPYDMKDGEGLKKKLCERILATIGEGNYFEK